MRESGAGWKHQLAVSCFGDEQGGVGVVKVNRCSPSSYALGLHLAWHLLLSISKSYKQWLLAPISCLGELRSEADGAQRSTSGNVHQHGKYKLDA